MKQKGTEAWARGLRTDIKHRATEARKTKRIYTSFPTHPHPPGLGLGLARTGSLGASASASGDWVCRPKCCPRPKPQEIPRLQAPNACIFPKPTHPRNPRLVCNVTPQTLQCSSLTKPSSRLVISSAAPSLHASKLRPWPAARWLAKRLPGRAPRADAVLEGTLVLPAGLRRRREQSHAQLGVEQGSLFCHGRYEEGTGWDQGMGCDGRSAVIGGVAGLFIVGPKQWTTWETWACASDQ